MVRFTNKIITFCKRMIIENLTTNFQDVFYPSSSFIVFLFLFDWTKDVKASFVVSVLFLLILRSALKPFESKEGGRAPGAGSLFNVVKAGIVLALVFLIVGDFREKTYRNFTIVSLISASFFWGGINVIRFRKRSFSCASMETFKLFMLVVILIVALANGHGVYDSSVLHWKLFVFIGVLALPVLLSWRQFIQPAFEAFRPRVFQRIEHFNQGLVAGSLKLFLIVSFLVFGLILAVRNDMFLWVDGSLFHWAYFAGPTSIIKAGHASAFTVLTQYSPWASFFAALLPGGSYMSLYILQALLLVLCMVLVTGLQKLKLVSSVEFCSFLVILFLADPSTVGPQSFPSSSVLRFFPCYIWCFIPVFILFRNDKRFSVFLFTLMGCLFCCWGGEFAISLFVATAISLFCSLFFLRSKRTEIYGLIGMLVFTGGVIALGLNTNLFEYQFNYLSQKHGWTPPENISNSAPLILTLLILIGPVLSIASAIARSFVIACMMVILGYYSYRPISHNIVAVLPLLMFLLFSVRAYSGEQFRAEKTKDCAPDLNFQACLMCLVWYAVCTLWVQGPKVGSLLQDSLKNLGESPSQRLMARNKCSNSAFSKPAGLARLGSWAKLDISSSDFVAVFSPGVEIPEFFNCLGVGIGEVTNPIFYPPQLYLDPLSLARGKQLIQYELSSLAPRQLVFVVENAPSSILLMENFLKRLPENWRVSEKSTLALKDKSINVFILKPILKTNHG